MDNIIHSRITYKYIGIYKITYKCFAKTLSLARPFSKICYIAIYTLAKTLKLAKNDGKT